MGECEVICSGSPEARLAAKKIKSCIDFHEVRFSEIMLIACFQTITESSADCLRLRGSHYCKAEYGCNDDNNFFHFVVFMGICITAKCPV